MIEKEDMIKYVEENGAHARGRNEYLKFLRGENLSLKQAVLAHCYDCTNMEAGRQSCDIDDCTLFQHHNYNPNKRKTKTMSEENKRKASDRFKKMRGKK